MEVSELAGSTAASTSGTVHGVLVGEVSLIKPSSLLSLSRSLLPSLSSLTSSTSPSTLLTICMLPRDIAQKLYGLSIVFYRSQSVHTRRSDVYTT